MKHFKRMVVFFLIFSFIFGTSLYAIKKITRSNAPQWDCCWQIWATGANLGWATSLMWYTKIRRRWAGTPDNSLYKLIIAAGGHLEMSNRVCSKINPAWQNWRQKKNYLNSLARSFINNPSSSNRRSLHSSLKSTYSQFSALLKTIIVANRFKKSPTCSEKYFKLAWLLSYTQQTLKIADEAERNRRRWKKTVLNAKNHIKSAINVLYAYFRLKPITGRCVKLTSLNLINRLREINNMRITVYNLGYMITEIDSIWGQIDKQLKRDCKSSVTIPPHQGLTNISVNNSLITVSIWDHGKVDGDRVNVYLNNRLIKRNLYLSKKYINLSLRLRRGANYISIYAINEGSESPNTASIKISNVIKGRSNQKWRLKRGKTGKMKIYYQSRSRYRR